MIEISTLLTIQDVTPILPHTFKLQELIGDLTPIPIMASLNTNLIFLKFLKGIFLIVLCKYATMY